MRIVAVGNSKGGATKTTLAANLIYTTGGFLGLRVLGLDCDVKQASLVRIAELRRIPGPPVKKSAVAKLAADLDEAREKGIDLVVIDLPGYDDASYSRVIEQADLVVVPMQPTVLDGEASRPVMRAAKALDVPYTIVVSRVINRREPAALRFLERYAGDARVAPIMIHQRAAFQDATALGLGVVEYQPRGAAADEVRALTSHIMGRLQGVT